MAYYISKTKFGAAFWLSLYEINGYEENKKVTYDIK